MSVQSTLVWGASDAGQFAVKGIGKDECREFLEAREKKASAYTDYGHYIAGYVTASNRLLPKTVDVTTWESIDVLAAYVDNLCRHRPDVRLVEAIEGVFATLMPTRVTADAEIVEVSTDGRTMRVYRSVLLRAKDALAERGLFDGPIDGEFTAELKETFRRFQRMRDLPETGLPDQATLYLLLRPGTHSD